MAMRAQGGLPFLAQPQGGPGLPASLQSQGGPPLLPPNALANPAVATAGGLAAPVDTTATPSFTSVVFDGYLSDCTVRRVTHLRLWTPCRRTFTCPA